MTWHGCAVRLGLASTLVVLGLAGTGRASTLSVEPTQIYFDGEVQSQLVTLRNQGDDPVRFQLTVYEWQQTTNGRMELGPTSDLVVFPTLFTVAPHSERRVRVGRLVPPTQRERTYRMFIEELPSQVQASVFGLAVRTKLGIPVFLAPVDPAAQGTIEDLTFRSGRVSFDIRNAGNVHFPPGLVRVRALDAAGSTVEEVEFPGWYVLATSRRHHEVDLPGLDCARLAKVVVEADLDGAVRDASVPVAPGCAQADASR